MDVIYCWEMGIMWMEQCRDNVDGTVYAKMVEGGRVDALWGGCEWVVAGKLKCALIKTSKSSL